MDLLTRGQTTAPWVKRIPNAYIKGIINFAHTYLCTANKVLRSKRLSIMHICSFLDKQRVPGCNIAYVSRAADTFHT
jgi:hypothetical protein